MPPPGSAAAKAKAAEGKPVIDPRTLAPKPGAKPVRPKPGRPALGATVDDGAAPTVGGGSASAEDRVDGVSGNGSLTSGQSGAPGPAQTPPNRGKRKRR
jgi:YidC/Oxa1 family membrane protein insertase